MRKVKKIGTNLWVFTMYVFTFHRIFRINFEMMYEAKKKRRRTQHEQC
jgi:hypothetical protein